MLLTDEQRMVVDSCARRLVVIALAG